MSIHTSLGEIAAYLERTSNDTIRECRRIMQSGISAFPPQVGTHYEAFWLRDFAYMLEGNPQAFTDGECIDACKLFIGAMREDGACVDCVAFDGSPIYMPGYGTMGDQPVADGSQFTVDVAWHTWKKTGDLQLVDEIVRSLKRALLAMPVNPKTGLISIHPGPTRERCPYGFTDTVLKEGDVLFCSLLATQAHRQTAELVEAIGQSGSDHRDAADKISASITEKLWDEDIGLFRAATLRCREPDIWGSAFATFIGITSPEQTKRIASYFLRHHLELTQRGQVRHLPAATNWEATGVSGVGVAPDTYQNGAYWATAAGWYCYALSAIDKPLALETLKSLVEDFKDRGIHEWVSDDTLAIPGYVASVALPLAAVRRLKNELS